jgi:hypothetical protein
MKDQRKKVCILLMEIVTGHAEKVSLPRDNYKEHNELSLIAMGEKPPARFVFRKPGAIHKARWMAVAIYGLKMYLFRDQLG